LTTGMKRLNILGDLAEKEKYVALKRGAEERKEWQKLERARSCILAFQQITLVKVKVKVWFLYSATYMVDQEQHDLTISEVAVDWHEPVVLQRKCGHPLPTLTDIGPAVAASKHTTAPINHARHRVSTRTR